MQIKEAVFLGVVLFANIIEGITGFAGTMLAMPVSMLLLGVKNAKTILNLVAIFVSGYLTLKNHKDTNWMQVVKISCLMLIGMAVGVYVFQVLPLTRISKLYGFFILIVAAKGLLVKKEPTLSGGTLIGVLLGAGVIHGMFLSGGSLLVIYAVAVLKDKSVIRATLSPVWLILNLLLLVQDCIAGNFTTQVLALSALCIVPVIVAMAVGSVLHKKLKQAVFVKLTYVLLIVSGITLLA